MPRETGVDGCRGGWLAAWKARPGEPTARVFPNVEAIISELTPKVLAIDIPVGLPDLGERRCDVEARVFLGAKRHSSVFPAPVRAILAAATYDEANRLRREAEGKGMSKQAYGIHAKVCEVDALLQRRPELRGVVWEVHPEVSFAALRGEPIVQGKRSREGKDLRVAALRKHFDDEAFPRIRALVSRREATDDDILDALVCLWTAERISHGRAVSIPPLVPLDPVGIPMRIVY